MTGFQKFLKAISFGLIDPGNKPKSGSRKLSSRKSASSKKGGTRRKPEIVEPTIPRLYVGNLSYDVTDEELNEVFSGSGTVKEASVVRHGGSGRSKGFAFVEMSSLEEAKAAASKLNDKEIQGRSIFVTGAKAQKSRSGDDRRGDSRSRSDRDGGRREGARCEGGHRESSSSDRGDRSRRERKPRDRRGGRGADEEKKQSRQVRQIEIEKVESPILLVGNVNADASDQDIQDLFGGIGAVASKEAVGEGADKLTQDLKVEFSEVEGAQTAVELLQGKSFMGHQLKVTAFTGEAADKGGAAEAEPQVEEAPETSEAETAETEVAEVAEVAEAETSAEEAPSEEPAPVEEAAEAEIRVEEVPSDDQASEGSTPEEEEWSPSAGDKQ
ncbi:MAG: hypothetical protein L7V87_05410 [Verrucomicrobiales bacterium]|nr:hypothetical protein [Verrucomicrobiales bacterium]